MTIISGGNVYGSLEASWLHATLSFLIWPSRDFVNPLCPDCFYFLGPSLSVCVVLFFPPTLADTGLDSTGAHARFHMDLFLVEKRCFDPEIVSLGWLEEVAGI